MHDQTSTKPPTAIQQVSDEDMATFVGKDWDKYEPMWTSIKYKKNVTSAYHFKNLNWLAFFFGPVWFAYRKMYLSMICYISICIGLETVLDYFFQKGAPSAVYALVAMLSSRIIYFYVNAPRILAIRNAGGSEEAIKDKLAQAGGVSNGSLWIGLVIAALLTALIIWSADVTRNNALPIEGQKPIFENQQESEQPTDGSLSSNNPNVQIK